MLHDFPAAPVMLALIIEHLWGGIEFPALVFQATVLVFADLQSPVVKTFAAQVFQGDLDSRLRIQKHQSMMFDQFVAGIQQRDNFHFQYLAVRWQERPAAFERWLHERLQLAGSG